MPIINKGIFDTDVVFQRQVGTDWPSVNTNIDLFVENLTVANTVSANTFVGIDTDQVTEGSNLYFTERRAIDSFTAGRNIIILENGTISSTAYSDLYSLDIDGSINYNVTDSFESGITFPGQADNDRFALRSFTVTNISDSTAYIDANVLYYTTGNSATLANKIPVPVGGYLEFINKTQILQPNDKVNLQAFDASLTPANNILSAIFTFETLQDDIAFIGTGVTMTEANANIVVYQSSQSYTILESIKLVNTVDHVVRAKVFWADANSELKSYFVYNLPLPPNSSVEILQKPKRINIQDKIIASYSPNSAVSVFVSGRSGSTYEIESFTETYSLLSNSSIFLTLSTTADEGSELYYTVE